MNTFMTLQTLVSDTLSVESKVTETIETIKNTPAEVLISDFIEKAIGFGLKLLAAFIIYSIGVWLIRKIKKILENIFERKQTDAAIASFIKSITSIALTIMLIIVTVGTLGVDTTSLAALLAGGGMAIGMALNGTVQNFAGGIMILIFKPFKAGDYIQAQGYEGTVSEVSIVSTKLTTLDNKNIIIPNGILSNNTINNYSQNTMRRVDWNIDVEYGSSSEQTKTLLMACLDSDPRVLSKKDGAPADPFVAMSALKDSGVQFTIRAWVLKDNYWAVNFEVLEKIYNELPRHGIQFPFPQLDVNIKQN